MIPSFSRSLLATFSTPFFFPPLLPLSLLALHSRVSRAANHYPQSQPPNLSIFLHFHPLLHRPHHDRPFLCPSLLSEPPSQLASWQELVNWAILTPQCLLTPVYYRWRAADGLIDAQIVFTLKKKARAVCVSVWFCRNTQSTEVAVTHTHTHPQEDFNLWRLTSKMC